MKTAISTLKFQIKAAAETSREIRKQIHASSGDERWGHWHSKRGHGATTRKLLLAYACLRGRPYELVERKCQPGNEPSPSAIRSEILKSMGGGDPSEWTVEHIRGWLARPEIEQAQVQAPEAMVA